MSNIGKIKQIQRVDQIVQIVPIDQMEQRDGMGQRDPIDQMDHRGNLFCKYVCTKLFVQKMRCKNVEIKAIHSEFTLWGPNAKLEK